MAEIAFVAVRPPGFDRMAFVASTQRDRELLAKAGLGEGEEIVVKYRLVRNPRHHRLVFALLRFVFDNQDIYTNEDDLREALTLQTSFTRTFRTIGGRWERRARSWSFDELDEADFSKLHEELVAVVLTFYGKAADTPEALAEGKRWLKEGIDHQAATENLLAFA